MAEVRTGGAEEREKIGAGADSGEVGEVEVGAEVEVGIGELDGEATGEAEEEE